MQITANLVWSVLPPTLFPPFGYLILNSFKNQNTHEKRLAILENYYPFLEWIQMKSIIWNLNFMFTYEKQQSIFVLNQFTSDGPPEWFFFNKKDFFTNFFEIFDVYFLNFRSSALKNCGVTIVQLVFILLLNGIFMNWNLGFRLTDTITKIYNYISDFRETELH